MTSSRVMGVIPKAVSFIASTQTPPKPMATAGPNWSSLNPPIRSSNPGGIISSKRKYLITASGVRSEMVLFMFFAAS